MISELRLGKWQEVLTDVDACDAVITDPPYSARTHEGHNVAYDHVPLERAGRQIIFSPWTEDDVRELCDHWAPRVRCWFVAFTDHVLFPVYEAVLRQHLYVFAPIPYIATGSRVRLFGDGPSSWTTWIVVARTKEASKWGALRGAYVLPPGFRERKQISGGKELWVMHELLRDYTHRGQLVVDPCAGAGTTQISALAMGRGFIGAEADQRTHALALARVSQGYQEVPPWADRCAGEDLP